MAKVYIKMYVYGVCLILNHYIKWGSKILCCPVYKTNLNISEYSFPQPNVLPMLQNTFCLI